MRICDSGLTALRTRALAIVLMKEVMPLLDTLGGNIAAGHLQMAIDTVGEWLRKLADGGPVLRS